MSEKIEPVAEDFHDRLYGLTFKLFLNPNEDTPNNEIRLVLGATVGSGDSEVAYFHAEQGVLHDATTVSALEARVKELEGALRVALDAIEETCNEMTVGDRFTHAGQSLLDALPSCRNVITGAKQP